MQGYGSGQAVSHQIDPHLVIGQLKLQLYSAEIDQGRRVVWIYQGRRLQDELTLNDYNIPDNGVIHCLIQDNQAPVEASAPGIPGGSGPASPFGLFVGCTVILGMFWGLFFSAGDKYFSTSAFVMLVALSILLLVVVRSLV
jgi:hypothetical protein